MPRKRTSEIEVGKKTFSAALSPELIAALRAAAPARFMAVVNQRVHSV